MANIKIPKQYRTGFEKLRQFADDIFEKLLTTINRDIKDFRKKDIEIDIGVLIGIDSSDVKKILEALISIHTVLSDPDLDISKNDFINDICDALQETAEKEVVLSDEEKSRFKERLKKLLDIEALKIQSKVLDLQASNERSFCSLKIITDIRPVFGLEIKGGIKESIIQHTMQISYHENEARGEHKTFYLVIDKNGLKSIRDALDRAEEKQSILEKTIESMNINNFI